MLPSLRDYSKRRRSIAWLLLAWCCTIATACAQDAAVRGAVERGTAFAREGHLAEAESAFRQAVQIAPKIAEVHLDLALVLARENKLDAAIAAMREAVALNPSLPSAHLFLGIFLFQTNDPSGARTQLQAELALNPDNVEALTWLGTVELTQNHPEAAASSLDRAVVLAPNDLDLLELQGRAHSQIARNSYAKMAKLDPNSWHVHRVQAQMYAEAGEHTQAIAEYEAALKQQPRNPDLLEALGDEYRATSRVDSAAEAYRKELELVPANPVAMYNVGSIAIERGDPATGVPLLQAMIKVYPDSAVAEYYLGRGLAESGQYEQAADWLKRSAAADPNGEIGKRSWYELTRIDNRLHRTTEAEAAQREYTRIRDAQETKNTQESQNWKKLAPSPSP